MEMKKKLPIGIENFEKIRTEGFYYIDKTGLIKDLLQNWGEVNLFTRPRRFGKSLNMSMLKSFFEIGCDSTLFEGLQISKERALCETYLGKFPVIYISMKGVNGARFETARGMAVQLINEEARRMQFLLDSAALTKYDKEAFISLLRADMDDATLASSLRILSELLRTHYGKEVIILIDEYDVPLDKAMQAGYYDEMVNLIRNLFGQALKSNDSLQFAVLTGCLRVSKESIFTGLNNPKILSITNVEFDEYFGFTDDEVRELLDYYGLTAAYGVVKEWYDGYRFGNVNVYCPWDVICYCNKLRVDPEAQPEAYWSNTSGNDIIRHFIEMAKGTTRREIEQLMAGNAVEKMIRQELTYKELYDSIDNLWSILFTTGYLTTREKPERRTFALVIPNIEIRNIFETQILEWFQNTARQDGMTLNAFCEAFREGNGARVEELFHAYLRKTISIRDTAVRTDRKESLPTGKATTKGLKEPNPSVCFYHGILLGLLSYKDNWILSSNKETGEGYSDILVEIDEEEIGIIIEVKYSEDSNLEAACREALEQIEKKRYEESLRNAGMVTILKYGIACHKKQCRVVLGK